MNFGHWLKEKLDSRNINQLKLSELSGVSQSTISRWLRNERDPEPGNLRKILEVLEIPEREGLLAAGIISQGELEKESEDFVRIPFLSGQIPCGVPVEILDEYVISTERIPKSFLETIMGRLPKKQLYLVRVKGDSMIGKGIANDDLVIFTPDAQIQSGDIVVAFIEDIGLCIKEIFFQDKIIVLKPANPAYNPIVITSQEFKIVGKVLMKAGKL